MQQIQRPTWSEILLRRSNFDLECARSERQQAGLERCGGVLARRPCCGHGRYSMCLVHHRPAREAHAAARERAADLSLILAEYLARTVQSVDVITRSASADNQTIMSGEAAQILEERIAGVVQVRHIKLVDQTGVVVRHSDVSDTPPVNVSDREFFQAAQNGFSGLFIGVPVRSRIDGKWMIPMVRRIEGQDRNFKGIVAAGVDPEYLYDLFDAVTPGVQAMVSLFHEDGMRLVPVPHEEEPINAPPLFTVHLPRAAAGTFVEPSESPRIVSYRRVPGYPLVVATSIIEEAALEPLFRQSLAIGVATGTGCIIFAGFVLGLGRQLKRFQTAAADLRESDLRYRALLDAAQEGIILTDAELRVQYVNPRLSEISGFTSDALTGRSIVSFLGEANKGLLFEEGDRRQPWLAERYELKLTHPNGGDYWVLISVTPRAARDGGFSGSLLMVIDVTERKQAEHMLTLRAKQQQAIATLAQLALEDVELVQVFRTACEVLTNTLDADFSKLLSLEPSGDKLVLRTGVGWDPSLIGKATMPAGARSQGGYALLKDEPLVVTDLLTERRFEIPPLLQDAGVRSGVTVGVSARGEPYGALGVHSKVPGHFSAEDINFVQSVAHMLSAAISRHADADRVEEQRSRLQGILGTIADGVITVDEGGRIESLNRAGERQFEYVQSELQGQELSVLLPEPHRGEWEAIFAQYLSDREARRNGSGSREITGLRKGGRAFPAELALGEIRLPAGQLFIATVRDLTERKAAEDLLRQAQKMEAVGQLTGGIAHDFNNLLTVVLGNAELLEEELADQPEVVKLARVTRIAAERGAGLTSQLLAFSRKQSLRPVQLDLNQVATDVEQLFKRTLGEHITVTLNRAPDLGKATADRTLLESALLNLAVNARDAMPSGGDLIIETANATLDEDYSKNEDDVEAGEYVMLAMSDTGIGMTPEVRAQVFEPFFTTKPVGMGSGLGLSMVYGFIKQSKGHIRIYSEVGHGTTVKLYLPRTDVVPPPPFAQLNEIAPHVGREAKILVVEDNPAVRQYVTAQLRNLGYMVIEATDGPDACERLREDPDYACCSPILSCPAE